MDYLPKPYHTKIWRAIYEHELIEAGDRIAVGLSGGKDSMFACYALSAIRRYSKIPFSLSAITIDLGFEQSLDRDALEQFCSALEISFHYIPTRIADIIRARERQESRLQQGVVRASPGRCHGDVPHEHPLLGKSRHSSLEDPSDEDGDRGDTAFDVPVRTRYRQGRKEAGTAHRAQRVPVLL